MWPLARYSLVALFSVILTLGAFIFTRFLDSSVVFMGKNSPEISRINYQLNCSLGNQSRSCPANYYPSNILMKKKEVESGSSSSSSCPDYFRWIHEDLWPWRKTGITKEMVMSANTLSRTANFRLVIVDGKAYVETYRKSFQTRDNYTVWGILQLLRRYPGKLPDLELMFDCIDMPVVIKENFSPPKFPAPPPIFRYCGHELAFDIVFPDWSFWGWPGINAKPWEVLAKELEEGNKRIEWKDREAYAFWKGNPKLDTPIRMELLKCNVSDKHDWGARLYAQDWLKEEKRGFKNSNLASQCIHRYKIYIEGFAWSVSEKYILACDSMALFVKTYFYDFFSRSLLPLKHYWPIKDDDKCRSIKHAVDWGNTHQQQAEAIGKAGSSLVLNEVKMDYVYDYMFHLLNEYAKLLKYKPSVPKGAVEVCSESIACPVPQGLDKKFMADSVVKGPYLSQPCTMPPPYDPASLRSIIQSKENGFKLVDTWEKEYWKTTRIY